MEQSQRDEAKKVLIGYLNRINSEGISDYRICKMCNLPRSTIWNVRKNQKPSYVPSLALIICIYQGTNIPFITSDYL